MLEKIQFINYINDCIVRKKENTPIDEDENVYEEIKR